MSNLIKPVIFFVIFTLSACVKNESVITSDDNSVSEKNIIVDIQSVDIEPVFNYGNNTGSQAIHKYIRKNVRYPELAREARSKGKVFVSFVVTTDGSVQEVELEKANDSTLLNDEALRVISEMSDWTPAVKEGEI